MVWKQARNSTFAQYHAISPTCNTSFQTNARLQAKAVSSQLNSLLRPEDTVEAFVGYNFVDGPGCPANVTTVAQARKALASGATEIIVVNQNNAQQSNTTNGVSYVQLSTELTRPQWSNVSVMGLDDYSQTKGFNDLVASFVYENYKLELGSKGVTPEQTCLLFACHGNPTRITKKGDPGSLYMRNNYAALQKTFSAQGFDTYLAFQNHGGKGTTFPQNLFPWSSPPDTEIVPRIANASCSHVLISGSISFVVDNSETLFDEAIDDRRMLNGKPAVVTPVFNGNPHFAKYLAGILASALDGTGPALRNLKK